MAQRTDEQDDGTIDASSYQVDMMRCLREVNIDNNTVGWCVHAAQAFQKCSKYVDKPGICIVCGQWQIVPLKCSLHWCVHFCIVPVPV